MGIKSIIDIVRNFLFNNVNKQFLIFLFFLSISGIFWLVMALNETYEKEYRIPVRITNIPTNVVLTSDEVDTVRVTIRDKGWALIAYQYSDRLHTVNVNFKTYTRNNGSGSVTASELQRIIYAQTPALTSKVSAIKPDKLEFYYNDGAHKRVPVSWTGRVVPEELYFISKVSYSPDSVDVYAPAAMLDSLTTVYTETLNYSDFRDTLTVNCRLAKVRGVKYVPQHVQVSFYTDVLTEESMDAVPITAINMPANKVLRTFPAKVKVKFVTGVSQFKNLQSDQFLVIADYKEIMANPSDKCNIYLKAYPDGISRASLEVNQVDYLIEEDESE
ncbi:MAG: YbbR-like domain-containing protein [Prevotella sp.]|nr:YbbR-like domain-containing protein [Prevotella sp.]